MRKHASIRQNEQTWNPIRHFYSIVKCKLFRFSMQKISTLLNNKFTTSAFFLQQQASLWQVFSSKKSNFKKVLKTKHKMLKKFISTWYIIIICTFSFFEAFYLWFWQFSDSKAWKKIVNNDVNKITITLKKLIWYPKSDILRNM